ncbi:hypothetical protein HHK36_002783 [Tetracentron sinense]|uniref:RRM domain-containing protein n=1 Tax=Tetracentron sinense TaxID=13715 RepID=A0A834ZS60_TETSI|nr:hypothetical protein HHK36_002783 [Tetracentron sinense]
MDSDRGKLFVGGVSRETSEDALKDHFNKYGEVVESVIMRDRSTGNTRGFGFVQFSDPSVADKALQDKHVILGRTVELKKAFPRGEHHQNQNQNQNHHKQQNKGSSKNSNNGGSDYQFKTRKIFVGGLSATLTEGEFKNYFEKFGRIIDVVVMYDNTTHRPRGFGFITFDSEEAVDNVMQKSFHELNGKLVEVKRAVPKAESNCGDNNYNTSTLRVGGGRGPFFGSYQGAIYLPYSPRYGIFPCYAPPHLSAYGGAGVYPYGASVYGGGYPIGGYGGFGYGAGISPPTNPEDGWLWGARCSPVPYGNAAIYPYMNGGIMSMTAGGYRGVVRPAANENWNQGIGSDAQMPDGTTASLTNGGEVGE